MRIKIFEKFKYSLKNNNPFVLYSKIFIVPKILKMIPIPVESESFREVHVLSCRKDFMAMLWSLYSFYFHSEKKFPLVVHDDGTLDFRHEKMLKNLFPGSRIIFRSQSDYEIENHLKEFPLCRKLRKFNIFSFRFFDFFYYCKADSMIIFDSDVLFFKKINDLFFREDLKCNYFMEDIWTSYEISAQEIERLFHVLAPEKINSGLGLIHKQSINIPFIEEILSNKVFSNIKFLTDQTITAILAAKYGIRLLPKEYCVTLKSGINGFIAKHYTRLIRNLLYTEGIPHLLRYFSENY